jgi:ketosteroid isomerase-like protein
MRRFLICAALTVGAGLGLTGCGSSSHSSELTTAEQKQLDTLAIRNIEVRWHQAESRRSTSEIMSLWAPNAVWEIDPSHALTGKQQIRNFWVTQVWPAARKQHWVSDTATFRIRTTVEGNKGTLYFECHEIDRNTRKVLAVVGQDTDVAKIGGRWLITKAVGSSPML